MSLVAGALVTFLVACLLAAAAIVAVPVGATVFAHVALAPIAVAVSEVHFLTCTNKKKTKRSQLTIGVEQLQPVLNPVGCPHPVDLRVLLYEGDEGGPLHLHGLPSAVV